MRAKLKQFVKNPTDKNIAGIYLATGVKMICTETRSGTKDDVIYFFNPKTFLYDRVSSKEVAIYISRDLPFYVQVYISEIKETVGKDMIPSHLTKLFKNLGSYKYVEGIAKQLAHDIFDPEISNDFMMKLDQIRDVMNFTNCFLNFRNIDLDIKR